MSSDSDNHPPPSKRQRRRQIIVPDSSEESDSSVHRNLRSRVTSKRTNGSEEAGTSRLGELSNGIANRSANSASPSANLEGVELKHRSTISKSIKVSEKGKEETATSSKNVADSEIGDPPDEQCPICLIVFVNQEVASPSSCEHFFCFACLMEWSKSTNTCPVDRKTFDVMDVRPKFGDKVERHIPVTVNTNGDEESTDLGDLDYSDDNLEVGRRIVDSTVITALRHIAFPRRGLLSSDSSSSSSWAEALLTSPEGLDRLNTSSESREDNLSSPSEPSENDRAPSSIECDEPSSPIVIIVSSDNEEIAVSSLSEASSPSDNREASSPSDNQQCSSPDRNGFSSSSGNHQISSPSDNQRSSSPSVEQQYSSVGDSPIIEEQLSSPSVKNEPLSATEGEEPSSEIERYSYSSDKEESAPPSEDERISDYDSEPSAYSSSS